MRLTFGCRRLCNSGTANIGNVPRATHVETCSKSQRASHALDEAGGMEKHGRMHDNFESSSGSGRLKHAGATLLDRGLTSRKEVNDS
jgi:hypothetical protein